MAMEANNGISLDGVRVSSTLFHGTFITTDASHDDKTDGVSDSIVYLII